jgi:hypothetical protein
MSIRKYPRTPHLKGSRLQPGDEDLSQTPFSAIAGRYLVVEEKIDGANAGISFDAQGRLQLQSRGHYLTGGPREKHFALFKQWASAHAGVLQEILTDRYVLYGEWLFAKHTVFYDRLPHYFLEFDILDLTTGEFLSTARRREMLDGSPVLSVPVLQESVVDDPSKLPALVRHSLYKSAEWKQSLEEVCRERGLDPARITKETDASDLAEGLYIKVEENGRVVERYKWIRASFLTSILDSESHWLSRPIVPNRLADEGAMFGSLS